MRIINYQDISNNSTRWYEFLFWTIGIFFLFSGLAALWNAYVAMSEKWGDNYFLSLLGLGLVLGLISGFAFLNVRAARDHIQK